MNKLRDIWKLRKKEGQFVLRSLTSITKIKPGGKYFEICLKFATDSKVNKTNLNLK